MIALILVVCIATVTKIGTKANTKFQSAASVL
jgi:Flp pilus assembly pilin Flp